MQTNQVCKLVRVFRVADMLDCSDSLIYQLVQEGKLEAYRVGTKGVRISKESLESYLAKNKIDPNAL